MSVVCVPVSIMFFVLLLSHFVDMLAEVSEVGLSTSTYDSLLCFVYSCMSLTMFSLPSLGRVGGWANFLHVDNCV